MDRILRKRRNNNIDNLDSEQEGDVSPTFKFLFKSNIYHTRKRWMGRLHIF